MATSQYNLSTEISNLLVNFYERKALKEQKFENGLIRYGEDAIIPEGNSATGYWHRWTKFALASDLSEGSQGSPSTGVSMDTTQVSSTLVEFGSFVRVTLFSEAIRLESAAKQAYIKFTEQASRTANRRILTALANTSTGFNRLYAGGRPSYAALVAEPSEITNKDIQRAANLIEKYYPPTNKTVCLLDPFSKGSLMINDADFRDLLKFTSLNNLKQNDMPDWAGASIDIQGDPWRESSTGSEGTYAAAGDIISVPIFNPSAFGKVSLMGKTGLKPKWHVQNIDVTGAEMTIGYRIPFATLVLNTNWGVMLKGMNPDYASISSVA